MYLEPFTSWSVGMPAGPEHPRASSTSGLDNGDSFLSITAGASSIGISLDWQRETPGGSGLRGPLS